MSEGMSEAERAAAERADRIHAMIAAARSHAGPTRPAPKQRQRRLPELEPDPEVVDEAPGPYDAALAELRAEGFFERYQASEGASQ